MVEKNTILNSVTNIYSYIVCLQLLIFIIVCFSFDWQVLTMRSKHSISWRCCIPHCPWTSRCDASRPTKTSSISERRWLISVCLSLSLFILVCYLFYSLSHRIFVFCTNQPTIQCNTILRKQQLKISQQNTKDNKKTNAVKCTIMSWLLAPTGQTAITLRNNI